MRQQQIIVKKLISKSNISINSSGLLVNKTTHNVLEDNYYLEKKGKIAVKIFIKNGEVQDGTIANFSG